MILSWIIYILENIVKLILKLDNKFKNNYLNYL